MTRRRIAGITMDSFQPNGCVIWQKAKNTGGYGCTYQGGRLVTAHRHIWEECFGPIPEGMHVLHRCDTPACVSPEHMFLGTHDDNMKDMASKGRGPGRPG